MEDQLTLECIDESLHLNVFGYNSDIDPMMLFPESVDNESTIFNEAFNTSKGNLLQKIWAILKKCWRWIGDKFNLFVNGIKKIFGSENPPKKSIDQIASNVLGVSLAVSGSAAAGALAVHNTQQKLGDLTDNAISDIASDVLKGDMKSAQSKHLRVEYDDGRTITFNILSNAIRSSLSVKGSTHGERWMEYLAVFFHCMKDPGCLDPLIETMQEVKDTHNINGDIRNIQKQITTLLAVTLKGTRFTVSMSEWTNFQIRCNKLSKLMETWDDFNVKVTQNGNDITKEWIGVLNEFAAASNAIQIGLNVISDSMRQSYVLDSEYHSKCKDIETLDNFVLACIESNIPSKYTVSNTKLFTDVSLNSLPNDATIKDDEFDKLSGHGRFVMFPSDNTEVIKIGYNRYGLRSNKIEKNVFDVISQWPDVASELCSIRQISKNGIVMILDRAKPSPVPQAKAKAVQFKINNSLREHGSGFKIVDINYKGFGYVNDKLVVLDYGQIRRTDSNMV